MVLLSLSLLSAGLAFANAASLTQVTDFGYNPTNAEMYIYVPDKLPANPAVILGVHYCGGTGPEFYNDTRWASIADTKAFIVVYPNTPNLKDHCWDVASKQTLTHDGGGDSQSIANMVKYTIAKYNADKSKVFMTGRSSGSMMTNVMAATYPDLFVAGSAYAGVSAGCAAGPEVDYWNADCAQGKIIKTGAEWAAIARDMYPGYTGAYPRMQFWHGTVDGILNYQNLHEEVKQWTSVWGVADVQPVTSTDSPEAGYTRMNYGDKVESVSADNINHDIPVHEEESLKWFGI
ncbi:hypothetical protein VE01_02934 [Pseudogymnoascus verrucosus]|uniref:Carboxylic ester hydrolase n=1 Tax=Pseudogymnoascus verrucosus TaxID=342668 RepID=A0A1B8GUV7_9PEZI|nr:uncharacterized protein VE01_02934 [Pseudogymnoascus verrucosus]OBT99580.1 hypothetical protein VE01_02934 [Pseudogymnoascus verrucosus]